MPPFPLAITSWDAVDPTDHPGEKGVARWRTQAYGEIRVRMVEYSPGYLGDHWCSKGHVIFCVSGWLEIEMGDGRRATLAPGQSCQMGDGEPPHRTSTATGATLFIVD